MIIQWLIGVKPEVKLAYQLAKRGSGRSIRHMVERALTGYLETKYAEYLAEATRMVRDGDDPDPQGYDAPKRTTPALDEEEE